MVSKCLKRRLKIGLLLLITAALAVSSVFMFGMEEGDMAGHSSQGRRAPYMASMSGGQFTQQRQVMASVPQIYQARGETTVTSSEIFNRVCGPGGEEGFRHRVGWAAGYSQHLPNWQSNSNATTENLFGEIKNQFNRYNSQQSMLALACEGDLDFYSVGQLEEKTGNSGFNKGKLDILISNPSDVKKTDVRHLMAENPGTVFQVASTPSGLEGGMIRSQNYLGNMYERATQGEAVQSALAASATKFKYILPNINRDYFQKRFYYLWSKFDLPYEQINTDLFAHFVTIAQDGNGNTIGWMPLSKTNKAVLVRTLGDGKHTWDFEYVVEGNNNYYPLPKGLFSWAELNQAGTYQVKGVHASNRGKMGGTKWTYNGQDQQWYGNNNLWNPGKNTYAHPTKDIAKQYRSLKLTIDQQVLDRMKFDSSDVKKVGVAVHTDIPLIIGPGGDLRDANQQQNLIVDQGKRVTLVHASAFDMRNARSYNPNDGIAQFARIALDGAYEGTVRAAIATGKKRVFLTIMGGGSFKNDVMWVFESIEKIRELIKKSNLHVTLVYHPDYPRRDMSKDQEFLLKMAHLMGYINNIHSYEGDLKDRLNSYKQAIEEHCTNQRRSTTAEADSLQNEFDKLVMQQPISHPTASSPSVVHAAVPPTQASSIFPAQRLTSVAVPRSRSSLPQAGTEYVSLAKTGELFGDGQASGREQSISISSGATTTTIGNGGQQNVALQVPQNSMFAGQTPHQQQAAAGVGIPVTSSSTTSMTGTNQLVGGNGATVPIVAPVPAVTPVPVVVVPQQTAQPLIIPVIPAAQIQHTSSWGSWSFKWFVKKPIQWFVVEPIKWLLSLF